MSCITTYLEFWGSLEDCTDDEWEQIYGAIRDNASDLEKAYPQLERMEEVLQSTVLFEENNCTGEDFALMELREMGFNEDQLRYFGFRKLDGPIPPCFASTYMEHELPEKIAFNLLIQIALWFREDCTDEHAARDELLKIGFDDEWIQAAWE